MKRIQIQLTDKKLGDVVEEMANVTVKNLSNRPKAEPKAVIKASIREVLEKYVHAYDTCGLATICQEGQEIDPWDKKGQDEDN